MADAEVEEAYSGSGDNEVAADADGNHTNEVEPIVEQIEPSVEYDPAQSVPDLSLPVSSSHTDSSLPVAISTVVERPHSAQEDQPTPSLTLQTAPSATRNTNTGPSPLDGVQSPKPHILPTHEMSHSAGGTQAPRTRLAHDTVGILEDRIKEDPKGDVNAWLGLVEEHKAKGRFDDARKVYDRLLEVFPQAVSGQLQSSMRWLTLGSRTSGLRI